MEIKAEVSRLERFANVLRHKHQVVTVHPNSSHLRYVRTDFNHFLSNLLVNVYVCTPVIMDNLTIVL